MQESLRSVLDIQELDIKMIRLMRVKRERQKELEQIDKLRTELHAQLEEKGKEVQQLGKTIQEMEQKIQEVLAKHKQLEGRQTSIKKVDEFNALTQEMTATEREKIALEGRVSDIVDKKNSEEEILEKIRSSLQESEASSIALENEIRASIELINKEGRGLKEERAKLAKKANAEVLGIYERLLRNKKDRVIVAVENRTCSGCHISLTPQHDNLVRKGKNLVFCEHCSRLHYWQETEAETAPRAGGKRRRRRAMA